MYIMLVFISHRSGAESFDLLSVQHGFLKLESKMLLLGSMTSLKNTSSSFHQFQLIFDDQILRAVLRFRSFI